MQEAKMAWAFGYDNMQSVGAEMCWNSSAWERNELGDVKMGLVGFEDGRRMEMIVSSSRLCC
jgi:hypothetical protein